MIHVFMLRIVKDIEQRRRRRWHTAKKNGRENSSNAKRERHYTKQIFPSIDIAHIIMQNDNGEQFTANDIANKKGIEKIFYANKVKL
jgi:hypothetical protein